jgi:hypothetical protein
MSDRTHAQLRQDRTAELARLKTFKAKLAGIIASADECNNADQNGRIGNCAFDIETLAHEISKAGHRLYVTCDAVRLAEDAAYQRQAEQDFAPALRRMLSLVQGAA